MEVEKVRQYGNLRLKVGTAPAVEFDVRNMAKTAVALYKAGKLKGKPGDTGYAYLPRESLSLTHQLGNMEIKLCITSLNSTINTADEEDFSRWLSYNSYLLIGLK